VRSGSLETIEIGQVMKVGQRLVARMHALFNLRPVINIARFYSDRLDDSHWDRLIPEGRDGNEPVETESDQTTVLLAPSD